MHAVWVSLTENAKCRGKLADVVGRRERCNRRCNNSGKAKLDGGELVLAHGKETPIRELVYHAGYTQAQMFGKCLPLICLVQYISTVYMAFELRFHSCTTPKKLHSTVVAT